MKQQSQTKRNACVRNLAIITLICLFTCVAFNFIPGTDITNKYKVYSATHEINNTYELMDYCHANNLQYSINKNVFRIENFDLCFNLIKEKCNATNNLHMNNITLLEDGKYDTMQKKEQGSSYTLKTWGTNYEMYNDSYIMYNMWPALITFILTIIFASALFQQLFYMRTRKNTSD